MESRTPQPVPCPRCVSGTSQKPSPAAETQMRTTPITDILPSRTLTRGSSQQPLETGLIIPGLKVEQLTQDHPAAGEPDYQPEMALAFPRGKGLS